MSAIPGCDPSEPPGAPQSAVATKSEPLCRTCRQRPAAYSLKHCEPCLHEAAEQARHAKDARREMLTANARASDMPGAGLGGWVTPDDPRYFDHAFWPVPDEGKTWAQARAEQVAAIKSHDRGTITFQDRLPRKRAYANPAVYLDGTSKDVILPPARLATTFPKHIPLRPYCADDYHDGLVRRSRNLALRKRHIQFNNLKSHAQWLLLDLDRSDAAVAHRKAGLPEPNVIMLNPENGHGHPAILLANPVALHDMAREKPKKWLAAIERGLVRRLGADRCFRGVLVKNPYSPHWDTEWRNPRPFTLEELASCLTAEDMRPYPSIKHTDGLSRNVTVFDETRFVAYREVLAFKRQDRSFAEFHQRVRDIATANNLQFATPLCPREVWHIAKSIARWTWRTFNEEKFRERQSKLGKRGMASRWAGHLADSTTEPWKAEGISRRTYYRRKKAAKAAALSEGGTP